MCLYIYTNTIDSKYKSLSKKVGEVNENNVREVASEVKELLVALKLSGTVKYEEEKKFVDNIYALVYRMIKIELIYNSRILFDYVKLDETDALFIATLIKKDIDKMNKNGGNSNLTNKLLDLEKLGLSNSYYLDEELIMILLSENNEVFDGIKKEFLVKCEGYNQSCQDLAEVRTSRDDLSETIRETKVHLRKINWKKFAKNMLFALDIAAVCSGIYHSTNLAKALTTTTSYKTVTEVYDSTYAEAEENVFYGDSVEDSLSLVEYSPWEEPGYFRDGYTRNVYTYDFSNVKATYDSIKDYLNSDLKDFITFSEDIETIDEKPEDMYEGNKYVIKRVMQDKSDIKVQFNQESFYSLAILFGFIMGAIDFLLLRLINKKLQLGKKKKECKENLISNQEKFFEIEEKINDMLDTLGRIRKEIYQNYDKLPNILKEDEDIKKKLLLLEDEKKQS